MSNNRNIKSRNKSSEDNSKTSLIEKVNSSTRPEPEKIGNKSSTNSAKSEQPKNNKQKANGKNKSFFFRLSKVGQVMFCIYIVGILAFGFLFGLSLIGKGSPQMGSRNEPLKVISNDDISKVKQAVEQGVKADKVDVHLAGYRLVVVMDLPDSSTAKDGETANYKAYKIVNTILPISDYFSSKTELNNDLFIYSSDVVPKDFNTNSKFVYQTYKNSKMDRSKSYDLLQARDKKSQKEVLDTLKKAEKDSTK